jgi:hypothetical protein
MAIIYSYPITTPQDSDLFIISRVPDDPDEISNFSVGVGTIAEYIIDKLIDPNAFDFQIPVFNQGGNRITGSIMSQDSSPSNGVAGTKITIAGNTTTTGNVQIDTLTNNYIPVNNNQGVLRDSGFYQVSAPVTADKAIGLNTTKLASVYGEYPDLRVASRSLNDPGVLDLFRPDGDVQAGDRVGILQYSLDDDTQYTVAQIEVKTIGNSGTGNTGGGKLCFKTSANVSGAQPTERLCIDNTEADFSVPINVTDLNQSSFAGQVTIPLTPIQNTDAASKGYVDSQLDKDLQIEGDTGTGSINLDTQVFDVAGGTYIDTAAGGQTITVDISAVDGNPGINERYLTKNNTWAEVATIPGTYRFNVNADTGTAQTVNTTETLFFGGGTYINTSVGIGPEVTFNHDDTALTTTSSSLSPGVGGSFSVIDSVTTNLQGHVTEINTLTVTLPQDTDNYVDSGTYSNNTGILSLTRTGGLADVDVSGFLEEAPSDGSQYARQNGGWSVVSGGGGGSGTVTSVAATHAGDAFTATIGNVSTVNPSVDITLNGSSSQYIDGAGNLTTFPTITTGTVESVGLSMPAAFSVANSPVTTSGTLTVTGVGTASQYIDGTGALQTFPTIPTVPANIVETIITTDGTFIDLTPDVATDGAVTITADLSATGLGTPTSDYFLRGDNTWAIPPGSGGGVGGNGTVNTIPIWSTTTDLADSQITQDNTGADPIFNFNSITGTNQYTPPTNTVLYKLKSGDANKFSITQDGGGGVVLPSGDILNNGPSFNMGGNAFANGENALSVGSATTAFGNGSFAANFLTLASGGGASAFGLLTEATALASAAFGNKSQSTGNYSIAAGQDSIASGQSSVAIGEKGDAQGKNTFVSGFGGTATANNAVKFGYEGSASGNNSAKFGFESVASGANSLATGTGTTASGLQSIATGDNNGVGGNNSFVGGKNSSVTGAAAFAFGQANTVSSLTSAAFGQSNTVDGFQSFVAGWNNDTNNYSNQMLLGIGLNSPQNEAVVLGRYNNNNDVFNKFQIGNGTAGNARSNALSINGAGYVKLPTYGSGAVVGTATRNLSVDVDGQIIETAIGGNTNYSVQVLTANATGQKNYLYVLQGSSAIELTLPSSPSSGDSIKVSNLTTVTTCTINPGSERIMSIQQTMTLDNNKAAFELIYVGPAYGWVIVGATGEI